MAQWLAVLAGERLSWGVSQAIYNCVISVYFVVSCDRLMMTVGRHQSRRIIKLTGRCSNCQLSEPLSGSSVFELTHTQRCTVTGEFVCVSAPISASMECITSREREKKREIITILLHSSGNSNTQVATIYRVTQLELSEYYPLRWSWLRSVVFRCIYMLYLYK